MDVQKECFSIVHNYCINDKTRAMQGAAAYFENLRKKSKFRIGEQEIAFVYLFAVALSRERMYPQATVVVDFYCEWIELHPCQKQTKQAVVMLFQKAFLLGMSERNENYHKILRIYDEIATLVKDVADMCEFSPVLMAARALTHQKYGNATDAESCRGELRQESNLSPALRNTVQHILL